MTAQRFRELSLTMVPLDSGYSGGHDVGVEIRIDGRPFLDLVKQVELGFEGKVAGGYASASLEYLRLVGETEDGREVFGGRGVFAGAKGATLLVCDCGDAGCWSLDADITVDDAAVRWDGLSSTPSRRNPAWSYSAIEPLVFDRTAYFRTVEALAPEIMAVVERRNG